MGKVFFEIDSHKIAQVRLPYYLARSTTPLLGQEYLNQLSVIWEKIQDNKSDLMGVVLSLASGPVDENVSDNPSELLIAANENEWQRLSLQGQELLRKWSSMEVPTVASLAGEWSGAALEIALCSQVMLASDQLQIHFASLDYGLIPALGGSYHLVQKVGIRPALEILLSRKKLNAQEAYQLGLVVEIVSGDLLALKASAFFTYQDAYGLKKSLRNFWWDNFLNRKIIFQNARELVLATGRGLAQAPLKLLDIMEMGGRGNGRQEMQLVASGFAELAVSEQAGHLLRLEHRTSSICASFNASADKNFLRHLRAGVVGMGQVGSALAQLLAAMQLRPIVKDQNLAKIEAQLPPLTNDLYSVSFREDFQGLQRLGLVFEATGDNLERKVLTLAAIERAISENCLLATVSKSLSVTELSHSLRHPHRLVGINFLPGVKNGRLVEIICHPLVSTKTITSFGAWVVAAGKIPLVVQDAPGYLLRNLLVPLLTEAQYLVSEGHSMGMVEQACLNFGLTLGPWQLMEDWQIHPVINLPPSSKQASLVTDEISLQMRLFLPVLKVAAELLEKKIVADPAVVDVALIYGLGYPASRGGLLSFIDQEGLAPIVAAMENFAQKVSQERFSPGQLLKTMAQEQRTFYVLC